MKFNPEITLGTICEIVSIVVLAIGVARKIGVIETKLNILYGWFNSEIINGHRFRDDRLRETEEFYKSGSSKRDQDLT